MATQALQPSVLRLLDQAYAANAKSDANETLVKLMMIGQVAKAQGYQLTQDEWYISEEVKPNTAEYDEAEVYKKIITEEKAKASTKPHISQSDTQPLIAPQDREWTFNMAVAWWALSVTYEAPFVTDEKTQRVKAGEKPMSVINRRKTKEELEIGRQFFLRYFNPKKLNEVDDLPEDQQAKTKAITAATQKSYKAVTTFKKKDEKIGYGFGRFMGIAYAATQFVLILVSAVGIGASFGWPLYAVLSVGCVLGIAAAYINNKLCWDMVPDNVIKSIRNHAYDEETGELQKVGKWRFRIGLGISLGTGLTWAALVSYGILILPSIQGFGFLSVMGHWLLIPALFFGTVNFVCTFAMTLQAVLKFTQRKTMNPKKIIKAYHAKRFGEDHINRVIKENGLDEAAADKLRSRYRTEKILTYTGMVFFGMLTMFAVGMLLYAGGQDFTKILDKIPNADPLLAAIFGFSLTMVLAIPGEASYDLDVMRMTVAGWVEALCDKIYGINRKGQLISKQKAAAKAATVNEASAWEKTKLEGSRFLNALGNGFIPVLNIILEACKTTLKKAGPLVAGSAALCPALTPATIVFAVIVFIAAFFNSYTAIRMSLEEDKERAIKEKNCKFNIEGKLLEQLKVSDDVSVKTQEPEVSADEFHSASSSPSHSPRFFGGADMGETGAETTYLERPNLQTMAN